MYPADQQEALDRVEARARHIAGSNHHHGAIPARAWRQAVAEAFLGEPIRDPEWAERFLAWLPATPHRATGVLGMSSLEPLLISIRSNGIPHSPHSDACHEAEAKLVEGALAAEWDRLREALEAVTQQLEHSFTPWPDATIDALRLARAALAPGTLVDVE